MQNPSGSDKNSIRKQMIEARERLLPEQVAAAGQAVADYVMAYVSGSRSIHGMVAGYAPIRGELDVRPAMSRLAAAGYALCLPVVIEKGQPLVFRRWSLETALEAGHYGTQTPHEKNAVVVPDIILVPLVAFDRFGHRLGYGGGYYDRTIAGLREQNKSLKFLGIAYGLQEVGKLIITPHDQKLDAVITEQGIHTST